MTAFVAAQSNEALDQGDVIDFCPLFRLRSPVGGEIDESPLRWHSRVIILTQACDIAQTKTAKILVAAVHSADDLVAQGLLKATAIRDQVRRGLVYGWYFLPAAESDVAMQESIVDLRELHTVSRDVLESLITSNRRVSRLTTPYREHLAQHFAVTYMRIGLPSPYDSNP